MSLVWAVQGAMETEMGKSCSQDAYRLGRRLYTNQQAIPKKYDRCPDKDEQER